MMRLTARPALAINGGATRFRRPTKREPPSRSRWPADRRHIDQDVHPDFPGDCGHGHGGLQVGGGHGHAEINSSTTTDDPKDIGRFEQVPDHYLRAGGPQGRGPVVLAADHRANRKPAFKEQVGYGSTDCPELTGRSGYEDRIFFCQRTSLLSLFPERLYTGEHGQELSVAGQFTV